MTRCNLLALTVLCLMLAPSALSQDDRPPAPGERADFVSDASHIVGTYRPPAGKHSAEEMAAAGQAFLAALSDDLRAKGALALDDPERGRWTNLPSRPTDGGVKLGALDEKQVKAACDLMASLFSQSGYDKLCQIMLGDDKLLPEGRPQQGIGTVDFAVMVFGNPSADSAWGFQLDGHHLGVNVTVEGEKISLSPSFVGAQPEEFTIAGTKYRPFTGELDDAYALIGLLDREQRIAAVLGKQRADLRAGPGRDGQVPEPLGTNCSGFNESQRKALLKLIANWVDLLPEHLAAERMEQLESEIDSMKFSWNGEIDPRSDMSYAIQSPSLIIEFACVGRGDRPLDHLHSIYRDPTSEYRVSAR